MNELMKIDYSDKAIIDTLKKTIAPTATNEEFELFKFYCMSTGLNPFKKEVWFTKTKSYTNQHTGEVVEGRVQIMTGINGFYAIANAHPMFDGIESEIVRDNKGKILRSISKVHRKDRGHPTVAIAEFCEFFKPSKKGNGLWEVMPCVMITKCSDSLALRKAFPQEFNGLYTQEEMPAEYSTPAVSIAQQGPPVHAVPPTRGEWKYSLKILKELNEQYDILSWREAVQIYKVTKDAEFAYSHHELVTWKEALIDGPTEEVIDDIPEVFKQEEIIK